MGAVLADLRPRTLPFINMPRFRRSPRLVSWLPRRFVQPGLPHPAMTWLLLGLGVVAAVIVGELGARAYYHLDDVRERHRRALLADVGAYPQDLYCVSHPYMSHFPAPGFELGANQHNAQGYRGEALPMERVPGAWRVLCLGGSTTYGIEVHTPEEAYPAQMEILLNQGGRVCGRQVEVLNAGVPLATTAELLTHYQFKYQYFAPDVVVVNTGGNDALFGPSVAPHYHPDYSHCRTTMRETPRLTGIARAALHSRLFALLVMQSLLAPPTLEAQLTRSAPREPPAAQWYSHARGPLQEQELPDEDLAFTRNLRRLVTMLQDDGARVVLVPFRIAPGREHDENPIGCERNERILRQIAEERGVVVAPLPADVISEANWVDSCHLNHDGCLEKAAHIADYVESVLTELCSLVRERVSGNSDTVEATPLYDEGNPSEKAQ